MESLYAGLNWAHCLRVILWVPIDRAIPANQRAQGYKGQEGTSLSIAISEFEFAHKQKKTNGPLCHLQRPAVWPEKH